MHHNINIEILSLCQDVNLNSELTLLQKSTLKYSDILEKQWVCDKHVTLKVFKGEKTSNFLQFLISEIYFEIQDT